MRRLRLALRLLKAIEHLEQCIKGEGTPYSATIRFDREKLTFEVEHGSMKTTGWPLAKAIERIHEV